MRADISRNATAEAKKHWDNKTNFKFTATSFTWAWATNQLRTQRLHQHREYQPSRIRTAKRKRRTIARDGKYFLSLLKLWRWKLPLQEIREWERKTRIPKKLNKHRNETREPYIKVTRILPVGIFFKALNYQQTPTRPHTHTHTHSRQNDFDLW